MPILLYAYLTTQILAPFFASLVILGSVLFLGNLIPLLETIIDFHITLPDFIRLYAYMSPQLFLFAIPMASMMGVILGFTRMANDGEIMVIKSCGTGLYKMLPPVILVALCTATITGLFSLSLIPRGTIAMDKMLVQLAREKINKGLPAKRFSENMGDIVLYADTVDKKTNEWRGIYITDTRDPRTPVIIMAASGRLDSGNSHSSMTLTLNNGSLHRSKGSVNQTMKFKRYTINLPIPAVGHINGTKPGKNAMNQDQLLTQANKLGIKTKQGADLLREYHKRLVLPVSCFIFSILGIPLGLLAGPGQRAIGIPFGLGVFTLYYIFLTAAEALSESLIIPVPVAMWTPNIIFALLTIVLVRSAQKESSAIHLERIRKLGWKISDRLPDLPWRKRSIS
jgi:lipopolysaccharide export system permease protein